MIFWLLALLVSTPAWADIHDTVLGKLAAATPVGEWMELPAPSLKAISLGDLSYSTFYYTNKGYHNPVSNKLSWIGGPGNCCANPHGPMFRRLDYDMAADQWALTLKTQWPTFTSGAGHGGDANAIDKASGDEYFALPSDRIYLMRGGNEYQLPPVPFATGRNTVEPAIEWFPEADALIYVGGSGTHLAAYRDGAWAVIPVPAPTPTQTPNGWGNYNQVAQYDPVHKQIWLGGGFKSYRLDANLKLTRLADPPFNISINSAWHGADPNTGHFISTRSSDRSWWDFDLQADKWTPLSPPRNALAVGEPLMKSAFTHVVYQIPELGGILYVGNYWTQRYVRFYRASATPEPPVSDKCIPAEFNTAPPLAFCPLVPPVADICAQPGVFICEKFDTIGKGVITAGNSTPRIDAGNLVFTIPSGSGANAGGEVRWRFPPLGEGKFLAFAYTIKADAPALTLPGRKEFVLWRGASSCTDLEFAQSHGSTPMVMPYAHCGSSFGHVHYSIGGGNFQMHEGPNPGDFNCTYHSMQQTLDGCAISIPDRWQTVYAELDIGHYGQPDSKIRMWLRTEDGPWRQYIDRKNFTFNGSGGFEQFMLTVYMTGKKPVAHPPGEVRYDYLIMGSQPIDKELL